MVSYLTDENMGLNQVQFILTEELFTFAINNKFISINEKNTLGCFDPVCF